MKQLFTLLVAVVLAFPTAVWATTGVSATAARFADQGTRVAGVVQDAEGNPIQGATVRAVSATTNQTITGTYTDASGRFSLTLSSTENVSIVVSYVNYKAATFAPGDNLSVVLEEDFLGLEETVVTGYGTKDRRDLTGSVAKVNGDAIQNITTSSFDQQLQGRAAGVQVQNGNGLVGSAPAVRIRGINSISSGTAPLYVIDGMPVVNGGTSGVAANNILGTINPNDIESIEFLKDASATAIYGSRGANGVVLITTRRGNRTGGIKIDLSASVGIAEATKGYEVLNAAQFINVMNSAARNSNPASADIAAVNINPATGQPYDTDWTEYIFRTGVQGNYNVSISASEDKYNFFVSLGATNMTGPVVSNDFNRYSVRVNADFRPNKWITLGTNISYSHTFTTGLNTGANALGGNLSAGLSQIPNIPAIFPDGRYNFTPGTNAIDPLGNAFSHQTNARNIAWTLNNDRQNAKLDRLQGGAYFEVKPIDGLTLRTYVSVDIYNNNDYSYGNPIHGDGAPTTDIFRQLIPFTRWNWQNTIQYTRSFGKHRASILGGYEAQNEEREDFSASVTNVVLPFFDEIISGSFTTPNVDGFRYERAFESLFGRINYNFDDKYLLEVAVRRDGVSDLAEDNRYEVFPGGSLAWRISKETFFEGLGLSFINELKLRGGVGRVGNAAIGLFPYAGLYGTAQYGSQTGIGFSSVGNPNLQYETSLQYNGGLDLVVLNNRLSFTFDIYRNETENLILNVPTPPSVGVPGNSIPDNIGKMTNSGLEFAISSVNYNGKGKDFYWETSFNISFQENEVNELVAGRDILVGTTNIIREGESINSLYGIRTWGVNPANGNPVWYRGNGTLFQYSALTGAYTTFDPANPGAAGSSTSGAQPSDNVILGQTLPKWFGGIRNNFKYMNFDAEVFITFSGGNYIFNQTRPQNLGFGFTNKITEILDSWTPENTNTDVPRTYFNQARGVIVNQADIPSSRFVEKGDFARFQIISLGYTFTQDFLKVLGISYLRVYGQVQNAFTITDYKGPDPELSRQLGVDYNVNPPQRLYLLGVNVSF